MKTNQVWKKLGCLYCPSSTQNWLYSHAAVPIADYIEQDIFKVYFSSRDKNNVSYTNSLLVDLQTFEVISCADKPVLQPGNLGEFDDSGAMGSWVAKHNETSYFYYIGWNLGQTVPFRNSIGLATAPDNTIFTRYAPGPIIDRTMNEPHFCASCCVIPGDDIWRMWYLSCTQWRISNGKPEHRYHIKYAESTDGIQWQRNGIVALDYLNENEIALSRPSVIFENNIWKMWFSFRSVGQSYRIGYAESDDGIVWQRAARPVLTVSEQGWDAEMVEYPYVFNHKGRQYMLYNGNGFGKTGFGLAVLEE